jgi:hypothetical protein
MYSSRFLMPCLMAAVLGLSSFAFSSGADPQEAAQASHPVGHRFSADNRDDYEDLPEGTFQGPQPTPGQINRAWLHAHLSGQVIAPMYSSTPSTLDPTTLLSPHPSRKDYLSTGTSSTRAHARKPSSVSVPLPQEAPHA